MTKFDSIWKTIADTRLISESNLAELKSEYRSTHAADHEASLKSLLDWLVEKNQISAYQANVISSGRNGPFLYDQYQLYDKTESGPLRGTFRALHQQSGHPVRLLFFPGSQPEHGQIWQQARRRSLDWMSLRHPFIVPFFEAVETDRFRLLVFDDPPGKTLFDKLPRRARLPWLQACQAAQQVAIGLERIHRHGLIHGTFWTGSAWIQPGGTGRVLWPATYECFDLAASPEAKSNGETFHDYQSPIISQGGANVRTDMYSFGAVLHRMVAGRPPVLGSTEISARKQQIALLSERFDKYELPTELQHLLTLLLAADISDELKDLSVAAKLFSAILGSQSLAKDYDANPPTLAKLEANIVQRINLSSLDGTRRRDHVKHDMGDVSADRSLNPDFSKIDVPSTSAAFPNPMTAKRSKTQQMLPFAVAAVIVVSAVLFGLMLNGLFQKSSQSRSTMSGGGEVLPNDDQGSQPLADEPEGLPTNQSNLMQRVVDDDGKMLWESPTIGPPINLTGIPSSPDFIFSIRYRQIVQDEQGQLFLDSLGGEFGELQQDLFAAFRVEPTRVQRLIGSLHANPSGTYDSFFQVVFDTPISQSELSQIFAEASVTTHQPTGLRVYHNEGWYFYFEMLGDSSAAVKLFIGTKELIDQSLDSQENSLSGGSLSRLVSRSDAERDITLIYRPAALVSQEGGWLFQGKLDAIRRPLHLLFDDRVQGVMFSMQFGDANYLELMLEHQSIELTAEELANSLRQSLKSSRDEIISYVREVPDHPFWSNVQHRFDNMVLELYRNTRVGIENGNVMANCWLPPMALHNLVAASELVLASGAFTTPSTLSTLTDEKIVPSTLEQLLGTPRSIEVTSGPDLIVLLSNMVEEVKDDYPSLGFEFKVKILGSDLLKQGITQNQRPGDVIIRNKPLSDILTQIMFQANPDKDATGPNDPKCELVWLIGPDPDQPDQRIILVTTRSAAAEKNLTLPLAFRPE